MNDAANTFAPATLAAVLRLPGIAGNWDLLILAVAAAAVLLVVLAGALGCRVERGGEGDEDRGPGDNDR